MLTRWGSCVDLLRGSLSWPGVVILWTGVWTLLNRHMPGGTGLWKELGLAVVGAWVMFWTRSLFSNAGMDSLDYEGSLSEMGALLSQGRLLWRDKAKFYAKSILAIIGSILFWDGVYTLCDEHAWESTLMYNGACAGLGGAGVVWAMTSEEDDQEDEMDRFAMVGVRSAIEGGAGSDFSRLSPRQKAGLYGKALFCNICSVVFWKGVEEIIEDSGPDTAWTGLLYFLVGVLVLAGTRRLSSNSGLDDGLMLTGMAQASPVDESLDSWDYKHPFSRGGISDAPRWRDCRDVCGGGGGGGGGNGFRKPPFCASFFEAPRNRRRCPGWVTTAAELTGVVFAWTGIEWYVWDDDYIADTWIRDILYVGVGLATLIGTGTFFNLAGTISPMAVLKQVHQHNRQEETLPLLSSDEALIHPDTP